MKDWLLRCSSGSSDIEQIVRRCSLSTAFRFPFDVNVAAGPRQDAHLTSKNRPVYSLTEIVRAPATIWPIRVSLNAVFLCSKISSIFNQYEYHSKVAKRYCVLSLLPP